MSLFDWMMRRNQRPGAEPIVPAAPENAGVNTPASPPPAPPSATPQAAAEPAADPYSAADFLPISRAEIVQAGQGGALLRNMWFGRRDLIPPADDPRTNIIDRALVTHGLLTPEELAEIHRVGDEMQRLRPTIDNIQL
jgi:hypothetical protein